MRRQRRDPDPAQHHGGGESRQDSGQTRPALVGAGGDAEKGGEKQHACRRGIYRPAALAQSGEAPRKHQAGANEPQEAQAAHGQQQRPPGPPPPRQQRPAHPRRAANCQRASQDEIGDLYYSFTFDNL